MMARRYIVACPWCKWASEVEPGPDGVVRKAQVAATADPHIAAHAVSFADEVEAWMIKQEDTDE
jgi:hypothetical protein